jgi:hypothetical protein
MKYSPFIDPGPEGLPPDKTAWDTGDSGPDGFIITERHGKFYNFFKKYGTISADVQCFLSAAGGQGDPWLDCCEKLSGWRDQ